MGLPKLDPAQTEDVVFVDHPEHDTIWTIIRGADGDVYVGLCLEGKGGGVAQLYRYEVGGRRLVHLADMGEVTGEPPDSGHATQGKIHFSLCQATDGKVYGATHCTTPPLGDKLWSPLAMWDDPVKGFPGAHVFRYDTKTGEAVDFGVITPNDGIPYLRLDEAGGRLYGVTYPRAHLWSVNLVGRDFRDYGRISSMYPISMVWDEAGRLWTSDFHARLIRFDPAEQRVVHTGAAAPLDPWNKTGRCYPITDMCQGPEGLIYGVNYANDHLFRFDPREERPSVEDLGPGLPEARGFGLRSLILHPSGKVYFTVYKRAEEAASVLGWYEPATGERGLVGEMVLGEKAFVVWRGVCDAQGNLYFGPIHRKPMSVVVWRGEGEGS